MKELGRKISHLREDILIELDLRRDGFFKVENQLKPVRPFLAKLRPEALGIVLVGVGIAGVSVWVIRQLMSYKKN